MSKPVAYFAYGSNMSSRRLTARIPSARIVGTGHLHGYRLAFHKFSHVDLSAKCDACPSDNPHDRVIGVLYHIHADEKPLLDRIEGVGSGYDEKRVNIRCKDEEADVEAFMYAATHIDPTIKPFHWYKEHVLRGAHEHGFPDSYLEFLNTFESVEDPQPERHYRELAIYTPR